MFLNRFIKFSAATIIAASIFCFSACSGDMHDDNLLSKSLLVMSLSDKTLTIPKGTVFNEDWSASNIEGTYNKSDSEKISFTAITIKTDSVNPTAYMELKDATGAVVEKDVPGTTSYTLKGDIVIKMNSDSYVSSTSFTGMYVTN